MTSSSASLSLINTLKERLMRSYKLQHEGDWIQAGIASDVVKLNNSSKRPSYLLFKQIGVMPKKFWDMAEALLMVPDRDVWIAVGWRGVSHLAPLSKAVRKKRITAVRKQAKGGKLPFDKRAEILKMPKKKVEVKKHKRSLPNELRDDHNALILWAQSVVEAMPIVLKLVPLPEGLKSAVLPKKKKAI